jgi:hypothetical protein
MDIDPLSRGTQSLPAGQDTGRTKMTARGSGPEFRLAGARFVQTRVEKNDPD